MPTEQDFKQIVTDALTEFERNKGDLRTDQEKADEAVVKGLSSLFDNYAGQGTPDVTQ